ncbi:MAG: hypothetical protein R3C01_14800 [Planctomycetaceae bacterium]
MSSHFSSGLQWFIDSIYAPVVRTCLKFPAIVVCASIALLILSMSLVRNGTVPWVIFPNLDARSIEANIIFPDGTPKSVTDAATLKMEAAINKIGREIQQQNGEDVVRLVFRIVGRVRSRSPGG